MKKIYLILIVFLLLPIYSFAAPVGVTYRGGSTFPTTSSLSSWKGEGTNAYKTLTDPAWDNVWGGYPNIDTVNDRTPIENYRGIDLTTEDGYSVLKFSSLAGDYPGRCRIKVLTPTDFYDSFFWQSRIKYEGFDAQIGNDEYNSMFTFYESSDRSIVLQRVSLTGSSAWHLRFQLNDDQIVRDNVTAVVGNKTSKVSNLYYIDNTSATIADDEWHVYSFYYVRHETNGIAIVWLDDDIILHFTGDTQGTSYLNTNIAVGLMYPWVESPTYAYIDYINFYDSYSDSTPDPPVITTTADGYGNACPEGADPITANYWLITDKASYCRGGTMTSTCAEDYPDGYDDLPDTYDNPGGLAQGYLKSVSCGGVTTVCAACSTELGNGGSESDMVTIARTIAAEEGGAPAAPLTIKSDSAGKAQVLLHSDTSGKAQITIY